MRIERTEMMMQIALILSKRSTCERGQTGCVIAREGRVISTGYNGPPSKQPHCDPSLCDYTKGCERSVHAEANAICFAARHGLTLQGATLYTLYAPCLKCSELIINSGIYEVVYETPYRDDSGLVLLEKSEVKVTKNQ